MIALPARNGGSVQRVGCRFVAYALVCTKFVSGSRSGSPAAQHQTITHLAPFSIGHANTMALLAGEPVIDSFGTKNLPSAKKQPSYENITVSRLDQSRCDAR